jgi:hypothetical protein
MFRTLEQWACQHGSSGTLSTLRALLRREDPDEVILCIGSASLEGHRAYLQRRLRELVEADARKLATMVRCADCGGTRVEVQMWCCPNEYVIADDSPCGDSELSQWCNDCDDHVGFTYPATI